MPDPPYWSLYFDGSKQVGGSGVGIVLKSPKGDKLKYVLQILFNATNNMAEYEALTTAKRLIAANALVTQNRRSAGGNEYRRWAKKRFSLVHRRVVSAMSTADAENKTTSLVVASGTDLGG